MIFIHNNMGIQYKTKVNNLSAKRARMSDSTALVSSVMNKTKNMQSWIVTNIKTHHLPIAGLDSIDASRLASIGASGLASIDAYLLRINVIVANNQNVIQC